MRASLGWPLLLLAACIGPTGSGGEPPAGPGSSGPGEHDLRDAPRFIGEADHGRRLRLYAGQSVELHLAGDVPDPQLEGDRDAVLVIEVASFDAAPGRRWELRAQHPGRCQLSVAGARPFVVDLEVTDKEMPPR